MANQIGKRYVCARCGAEMLVTHAGEGALACCGEPMQLRGAPAASAGQAPAQGGGERG